MITEQYTIPNIEPSSGALTEQGGNSIVSGGNLESLVFSDTSGYQLRPNGDAIFRNLTLTGGKLNYQKTSFTDSTNAGYYIGKEGIYFGSASDTKRLKFDIDTGAFDFIGTIAGRDTNAIAFGDQYGNLTKEVINAKLDTSTKEILGDFTFGASGAIKMNTDADNGLWISPTGLLGKKSGATTFAIDTSGNATFKGDITGSTGTFGSVTITSGSISWSTVGGTGKPADDATEGATLGTNVSGGSTDANNIDNSGYITQIDADSITTGKLTAVVVQTSASDNTGIKMSSTIGGMNVYGQTITFKDTSGNTRGYLGSDSSKVYMIGVTEKNVHIGSSQSIILDAAQYWDVRPDRTGVNLGSADYPWQYAYSNNFIIGNNPSYSLSKSSTTLVANGFTKFSLNGYSFKEVGFTFKDGGGNNKYLIVLATDDPVAP